MLAFTQTTSGAHDLLPTDKNSQDYCRSQQSTPNRCFLSGQRDANLLPGIAALHTLFLRLHNQHAAQLKARFSQLSPLAATRRAAACSL